MQVKLVPSLESAEHVEICGLLEVPVLLISIQLTGRKLPIEPEFALSVAKLVPVMAVLSSPKLAVPKLGNGRIPPERVQQGASAIHSADDRSAPETLELVLKDRPVVWSVMVTVNSWVVLL